MTSSDAASFGTEVTRRRHLVWQRTPVVAIGSLAAVIIAATGLLLSRPDIVVVATPLMLWSALVMFRPSAGDVRVRLSAGTGESTELARATVDVTADADWVQVAIDQGGVRTGMADVSPGEQRVRARSRLLHSGPTELLAVTARAVDADGAWTADVTESVRLAWNAAPGLVRVARIPVGSRLRGLHGAHPGRRRGEGGEFRDIHAFAPGDELRRVDWRATARLARRPGDLLVRRTDTLSEASVVIAIDTADDFGTVVATWGTRDPERSGRTSLDAAREAALSLATVAVEVGDRVTFHQLGSGGRSVPAGSGVRHLARLRSAIAGTGVSGDTTRFRRMPPVTQGAVVYVLSAFLDGAAADVAVRWHAAGHRVIAVDVLPTSDTRRLSPEQRIAFRTLMVEHDGAVASMRRTGVDVIRWGAGGEGADAALRAAARGRS